MISNARNISRVGHLVESDVDELVPTIDNVSMAEHLALHLPPGATSRSIRPNGKQAQSDSTRVDGSQDPSDPHGGRARGGYEAPSEGRGR